MLSAFELAYLTGSDGEVESVSDMPPEALGMFEANVTEMGAAAEGVFSRASDGKDMGPTAHRLTSTIMRMFWLARLYHGEDDERLVWFYGATEHCIHCVTLNGQVHTRADWREFMISSGIFPRSGNLECTGLYCQCGFSPTTEPETGSFI